MSKQLSFRVITKEEPNGIELRDIGATSALNAIDLAKAWVNQYPQECVYITCFNQADGQQSYLNPTGHSLTGYDWASRRKVNK